MTKRFVFVLIAGIISLGWGNTLDEIKREAQEIRSIRTAFVQKKEMRILSKPLVSQGLFYFERPASLRWEYHTPVNSVLLVHNGNVKRYVQRQDRYVEDRSVSLQAMQVVLSEITMWFKGEFDANPNFDVTLNPGKTIVLTPKDPSMNQLIQRIELQLSETPGLIQSVRIIESQNSITTLEFLEPVLNPSIPSSKFKEIE